MSNAVCSQCCEFNCFIDLTEDWECGACGHIHKGEENEIN